MHETGIENYYAIRDGKKLYDGYTTGTCAAAAAKAAAHMLATGQTVPYVDILTPKGIALNLEVLEPSVDGNHRRRRFLHLRCRHVRQPRRPDRGQGHEEAR